MIGYPSGHGGAILPAPNECPKFFFRKIFSVTVKRFSVIYVGIELENEKTETCDHFGIRLGSFSVLEKKV